MHQGAIRPNNICDDSKEELSWRMCMDYWELNKIIIKDKFPIPIIDDLLYELHGGCFFTRIDLYYRILSNKGQA